jgi:stearoyl-CoA 9-desaturase NADPH oxidoreductase
VPETADAATIWLRTPHGWPQHVPGQYVRVGVDVNGVRHWRTYSLTSLPGRADGRIAFTVKALPDGVVSPHLVNRTRPGTVVRLAPPTGDYVLPDPPPERLLFVTGGSGITPVAAMLRDLVRRRVRIDVAHIHLARTPSDAIFGRELRRMVRTRAPRYALREYHDEIGGRFTVDRLPALVGDVGAWDAWACGPAGLLDGLTEHWGALGISERLHLERFRPVVAAVCGEGGRVRFNLSGKTVKADGATPLLVAGEEAGAVLPSGCRMGICNSCVGRLTAGAVRDLRTGEVQHAEGQMVRMCTSGAAGAVEIDL